MAKIDNVLAILWLLRSGEKITAKQISERLEINIRTVYRYIDTLSISGVPIISEAGHNGGYTLLNNFIEAPLFFDLEEQTSLFHAAIFAEEAGYYGGESLNRAISKLRNYSNQEQETKINQHLTSLEVISGLSSLAMEPILKELEQAVADGYSIKILYHKRGKEQSKHRLVDPYRIIYWNNKWYLIGFCHLRNDIRSFRVDRMENLMLTKNKFNQPENFSARDFFMKNLLPTIEEKEGIISVVIKGNTSALDDICQHWFLGHYLQERTSNQAVFFLEKDMIHTYVPYLLLPYGTSIQVMEPINLKKRLIEVLSELIKFHQLGLECYLMQTKKVYLYVFNTMSDWEYGYLIAELNSGRYFKKDLAPLKVVTVGANEEIITTMGGLSIKPDISLDECILERKDLLILPGGTTWNEEIHQSILERIGQALKLGTIVAAICGAIEPLANMGYLDTRKHTSNNLEYTKMVCPNYKGEKFYEVGSAVSDVNLVTASGIAPLEFAMEVLKKLDVFAPDTLHSWYNLNKTHKPEYFFQLMNSINK